MHPKKETKEDDKSTISSVSTLEISLERLDQNDPEDKRDGPYAWFILVILFFIKSIVFGTFITYGVLFAEILKQGHLTREEVSWQFAIITPTENFSCLFVSFLSMYISWRQMEFIAAALGTIANLGAFFSESRALDIVLIGVIGGLCQAFAVVPLMAINNAYFKKYRSTAYGLSNSGPFCGALVLQYLVRITIENYGLKYSYLALAGANSINLLLTLFITKPKQNQNQMDNSGDNSKQPKRHNNDERECDAIDEKELFVNDVLKLYLHLLKKPYFHLVWITQLIFYWHYASMTLLTADYGIQRGLDSEQSNNLLAMYTVSSLLGRILPAFILDLNYIHERYIISFVCCSLGVTLVLITMTPRALYWAYMVLFGSLGFVVSFLYIILNLLYVEYIGEWLISVSFGLGALINGCFMLMRPLVIGYFCDQLANYNMLFQLMASVCIVVGFCWLLAPCLYARFCSR